MEPLEHAIVREYPLVSVDVRLYASVAVNLASDEIMTVAEDGISLDLEVFHFQRVDNQVVVVPLRPLCDPSLPNERAEEGDSWVGVVATDENVVCHQFQHVLCVVDAEQIDNFSQNLNVWAQSIHPWIGFAGGLAVVGTNFYWFAGGEVGIVGLVGWGAIVVVVVVVVVVAAIVIHTLHVVHEIVHVGEKLHLSIIISPRPAAVPLISTSIHRCCEHHRRILHLHHHPRRREPTIVVIVIVIVVVAAAAAAVVAAADFIGGGAMVVVVVVVVVGGGGGGGGGVGVVVADVAADVAVAVAVAIVPTTYL